MQGFGTLVGPAIGGITATPCQTFGSSFPLCEEGALFQRRCSTLCLRLPEALQAVVMT